MNESELAAAGEDFKARARKRFDFLVSGFGFEPAQDDSGRYSHCLVYRHYGRDQVVAVSNAFHPVDYGFEVSVDSIVNPLGPDQRAMVYFKLKEEQTPGFDFLDEAAQQLRAFLDRDP